jgi:ribonucleotide reductase alpha subunit
LGDPDYKKLSSMHFYAWKLGLKTGIYYLRTRSVASAQKFTVDPSTATAATVVSNTISLIPSSSVKEAKKEEEPKECLMCSA